MTNNPALLLLPGVKETCQSANATPKPIKPWSEQHTVAYVFPFHYICEYKQKLTEEVRHCSFIFCVSISFCYTYCNHVFMITGPAAVSFYCKYIYMACDSFWL